MLIKYLDNFYIIYLDNILIYSKDKATYILYIKKVLERLCAARLQVDIKKSKFYVNYTKYLGYIFTSKGLEVDSKKVEAL
jgi:hypothetical protein